MHIKKYNLGIIFILIFSPVMFYFFWFHPLSMLKMLTTDIQDGITTDANYYLFHALKNCHSSIFDHEYHVTWSSTGVVYYLTWVCKITQSKYFFIVINLVVFTTLFSFYLSKFKTYGIRLQSNVAIFSLLLMPYTLIQVLAPGKEIFGVSSLLLLMSGYFTKAFIKKLLLIILSITIAYVSRAHQAILILIVFCFTYSIIRYPKITIFVVLAGLVSIDSYVSSVFGFSYRDFYFDGSGKKTGLTLLLGQLLFSENILFHTLMSPIRTFFILFGPIYTSIFNESDISELYYWIFRDLGLRLRLFDTIILIYCLFLSFFDRKLMFLGIFSFIYLSIISFFGIAEKNRYIYELLPVLVPIAMIRRVKVIEVSR